MNLIIALLASLTTATAAFAGDLRINVQEFDASGTWKKPCGAFRVEAWLAGGGAGGGGGASRNGSPSGAGGNGAPGRVVIITYARNE